MPEIEIKDNPKLRSFLRNITEYTFTGVVWGIWVYLLLPVINIILWMLGFKLFGFAVIEQAGYKEILGLAAKMGWIILAVFLVLRLWGYYNYFRFGRKNRRDGSHDASIEQLAAHFRVAADEIRDLRAKKEVELN